MRNITGMNHSLYVETKSIHAHTQTKNQMYPYVLFGKLRFLDHFSHFMQVLLEQFFQHWVCLNHFKTTLYSKFFLNRKQLSYFKILFIYCLLLLYWHDSTHCFSLWRCWPILIIHELNTSGHAEQKIHFFFPHFCSLLCLMLSLELVKSYTRH